MSEKSDTNKQQKGDKTMSKKSNKKVAEVVDTVEVKAEKQPTERAKLIAEYRQLGKDMTTLRESHLKDIEALIVQYKKDKAAIKAKREELLTQIRKPKADEPVAEVTETEAA